MPPIKLTRAERWILANQCRILEALLPDEAESHAQMREALESGYELEYNPAHIEEDVVTADECDEVLDILNMHRALHFSYDRLPDKAGIDEDDVQFQGFDGNNETKQMAYARYYCGLDGGEQRFTELYRGDAFNSHMPVLDVYRRMLGVWKGRLGESHELTKPQIAEILAARRHPDRR